MNKFKLTSAFIIVSFLLLGTVAVKAQATKKTVEDIKIKTTVVCGMCKDRIEKNLVYEKGIKDVTVDLDTKIVTVSYRVDKTDPDKIRKSISKLGYDADDVPADQKAYNKLPECCKKGSEMK